MYSRKRRVGEQYTRSKRSHTSIAQTNTHKERIRKIFLKTFSETIFEKKIWGKHFRSPVEHEHTIDLRK